ncbi:PD40 domain-containing protein [Cellulophaga sp. HaHaR_3_176]|uniref:cell envelope biogenesis protein OmpA n=1 Tax=Cellulophaga sp. HaHaR_3_176 TaxID=1942464 RepID=UPI001C200273|nr:cell envelope biogenesis protein OmpA [Cellulophaga sp. HaHaR_3_176]QWX83045.1 PD40 domain-containing protein [Cellulophaga sp. HaHaR_3_176]
MKKTIINSILITTLLVFSNTTLSAQNSTSLELNKRIENFNELRKLGYQEKEIYEDLGNANFLSDNYETAIFWYNKLFKFTDGNGVSNSYYERYQFALQMAGKSTSKAASNSKDWTTVVKQDYVTKKVKTSDRFREIDFASKSHLKALEDFVSREIKLAKDINSKENNEVIAIEDDHTPIALTADGTTAYYAKPVLVKPLYGVFSKKELVSKIYKAQKIKGQWRTVEEVSLAPKNSSTMHPAVSQDGKRLFFASNMPGTFGEFDIYVADLKSNGTFGVAKNLGKKVNTNEDDLYPNIVGGTSLFFASNGHQGYGGLDVYMVEVAQNKVGSSVNLGSPINSGSDEFSVDLMKDNGSGYVLLKRSDDKGGLKQVAFSYSDDHEPSRNRKEYNSFEALNKESEINYSTSIFED